MELKYSKMGSIIADVSLSTLLLCFSFSAQAQERIRIGISSVSPGFIPTVIAEKKGFYTKYGLRSEHVVISLAIAINALGTGDLDYAISVAQGVSAALRGFPVKLVMMTQDKLDFFLMAKPEIRNVADLRGKNRGNQLFQGAPLTSLPNPF